MFELPEFATLARQINDTLTGKAIKKGSLGNTPHKFVWYNRTPNEFQALTHGKMIGKTSSKGKWLFVPLEPGYVLVLGECGGKRLYHPVGSPVPKKYHLHLSFEDGTSLAATTQMWGAVELYEQGQKRNREYIRDIDRPLLRVMQHYPQQHLLRLRPISHLEPAEPEPISTKKNLDFSKKICLFIFRLSSLLRSKLSPT